MAIKEYKTDNIHINFNIVDSDGSYGTSGQVLSRDAGGVTWINGSAIPGAGGTVTGTGVTGILPYWTNGPGGVLGDSIVAQGSQRIQISSGGGSLLMGQWDGSNNRIESASRPLFITSYTSPIKLGISGSTTMTIESSNVGIGTTSPGTKLDVNGNIKSNAEFQIFTGTTDIGQISNLSGALNIQGTSTRDVSMGSDTNPQSLFIEGSNGNVGIGVTDPDSKLDINAGVTNIIAGPAVRISKGASPIGLIRYDTVVIEANDVATIRIGESDGTVSSIMSGDDNLRINSTDPIKFYTAGTTTGEAHAGQGGTFAMIIDNSQNVGIGTTNPAQNFVVADATNGNGIELVPAGTGTIQAYNRGTSLYNTLNIDSLSNRIRSVNETVFNNGSGFSESMRIDSSGNVGIGTTSPDAQLEISNPTATTGAGGATFRLTRADSTSVAGDPVGTIEFYSTDADGPKTTAYIKSMSEELYGRKGSLAFGTSVTNNTDAVEAMRIDSLGNVGIGTTSPSAKLEVAGIRENQIRLTSYDTSAAVDETIGGIEFYSSDTGNEGIKASISAISANTEGSAYMTFSTGTNAERMRISSAGAIKFNAYGAGTLVTDASGNITASSGGGAGGPYLPLAGGTMTGDIQMSANSVKFDQSGTRSWDISAGSGNLNITSGDSGGNVFLSPGLVVEDATTVGGNLTVTGNQYFNGEFIEGDGKEMFRYNDAWLRINEDNDFSSGIYCGTSTLRTDGAFQVGSGGTKFEVQSNGTVTAEGTLTLDNGQIVLGGTGRIQGIDTVSANTDAANKLYVDNAIAGVPQGDITAVVAGDYLTGGGTSGSVTLNGDNTKLAHIVDSSNGSVTSGWITVAQASGSRKAGEIYVTDGESSDHSYIRIEWMRSYADSNFTVLNCGGHANRIRGVRVLQETADVTYGPKYLQVQVTATSNYYVIVTAPGTIPQYGDFIAETPVLENTKTGYAVTGAQLEDLHNSSVGTDEGITVGGDAYVNGGGITLGGVGRIQGIDTVSANTDAANKVYVDNAIAGVPVGDITGVTAGDGMTGGGTSGTVTLNVIGGTGITANANDIAIDSTVATLAGTQTFTNKSGNISMWTNNSGYITNAGVTQITAGTNVTISPAGGTGNVTINAAGGGGIGGSIAATRVAFGATTSNEIDGVSTFSYSDSGGIETLSLGDALNGQQTNFNLRHPNVAATRARYNLYAGTNLRGYLQSQNTGGEVTLLSNRNLILDCGSNEDIIMTSSSTAKVGIGNTSPSYKLDVTGTGRFTSTVTATNFILSSDERLKENIKDLEPKHIDPNWKSFNIKDSNEGYRVGVIAQELEVNHPEFVETDKEGFKSVKYIDLLISKIAELEDRIKQLEK